MKRAMLLALLFIGTLQISYFLHLNEWIAPLLLSSFVFLTGRNDYRLNRDLGAAAFLGILFIGVAVEPSLTTGSIELGAVYPGPIYVLYTLLVSLLLIILTQKLVASAFRSEPGKAMAMAAAAYILAVVPLSDFADVQLIPDLLFFQVALLAILSTLLTFIFIKSERNLLAPFAFLAIYSIFSSLQLRENVNLLVATAWVMVALSACILIADMLITSSPSVKRYLKGRRKLRPARNKPVTYVVIFSVLSLVLIVPLATAGSGYIMADPTGSMYPRITPGSVLVISHVSPSSVHVGEVIVFKAPWNPSMLYAHEVVSIEHNGTSTTFITRGIANPSNDPAPVPSYDLRGVVYTSIPYVGYILIYSKIFSAAILFIIAGWFIADSRK